jgi:geranylgeranyl diphosphate synthase type I
MKPEEYDATVQVFRNALNSELREAVDETLVGNHSLTHMLKYHMGWVDEKGHAVDLYPGKQIRPLLLLFSAQAAGGDWRQALPAAAAIELIHNFSLIHDDIEDNSPMRRGRPTLWQLWGIGPAINAGDAMFAAAHAALLRLGKVDVPPDCMIRVLTVFEEANLSLTRGQHMDLLFEREASVTVDDYLEMIGGKSAALIGSAMEIGALVGGMPLVNAKKYYEVGFYLGLAFQIQDDILGIWGNPLVTGKSAATDIVTRKKSLPVLFGLGRNSEFAALYSESSLDRDDIEHAVALLESVGARRDAELRVEHYVRLVREGIGGLDMVDVGMRSVLCEVLSLLVNRYI